MKKSPPFMANMIMNIVIAVILAIIANQTIFAEGSPFGGFFQEFLVIFFIITAADMLWKLVKTWIDNKTKK